METHLVDALHGISTATITMVLLKKGLRNVWIRGASTLLSDQPRIVGPAFTLRFIPGREDLATPESLASPKSTRFAIEEIPEGAVTVVASSGITDAGIFGDILCARMAAKGAVGLITDGAMRDLDGIRKTGLPVWCNGICAPPSVAHLTFVDWQQPIGCGGVAIYPNDVMVADRDGAVVIPRTFVGAVIEAGREAEQLEEWILQKVLDGRRLPGLYPPDQTTTEEYLEQKARQ